MHLGSQVGDPLSFLFFIVGDMLRYDRIINQ